MTTGQKGAVFVHLLMNDEHGMDTGRCGAVHFDDDAEWAADPLVWETSGPVCRVEGGMLLRFSRHRFPVLGFREWVGNWCWNAVTMSHNEALRLCRALPQLHFTCESAVEGSLFSDIGPRRGGGG
jgi:hypothetical protein